MTLFTLDFGRVITFNYTNYRGEKSVRRAILINIFHGATEYHPDLQWFVRAYDLEKHSYRNFALADIKLDGM